MNILFNKFNKNVSIIGISLFFILFYAVFVFAADTDTTRQIICCVDEIYKENPLPAGQKVQMIKLAETDTASVFLIKMMPGSELGPHYHKTHDETEYVLRGKAELFVDGKWVEFKPGSFHFNPKNEVHGVRVTGDEPLDVLIIFTPAMRETDRHFLK